MGFCKVETNFVEENVSAYCLPTVSAILYFLCLLTRFVQKYMICSNIKPSFFFGGIVSRDFGPPFSISLDRFECRDRAGSGLFLVNGNVKVFTGGVKML
jgi:hypothetical protein